MAPDGALNMVACSRDDQIGPHNMFWQFSAGGAIEHGTPPTLKYGWNCAVGAQPAGTGTYQIVYEPFDSSGGVAAIVVQATLQIAALSERKVVVSIQASSIIWFAVYNAADALVDLGAGDQLHFTVIGRRIKQTAAVNFGSFKNIDNNMGLAGL